LHGIIRSAWRFAGEMREIATNYSSVSLPDGFHEGAAKRQERMAGFKNKPPAKIDPVIEALLNHP
tara:strand:+ start:6940 stop:7134 length:195 start_codon:yes stop_codon:yes gene_type:complete